MTVKETLAKLSTYASLPLDRLIETPEAKFFINNRDILVKLEPYMLPEITRLICSSETLRKSFGTKYDAIYKYYTKDCVDTFTNEMPANSISSAYYIEQVFPFADEEILNGFKCAYNRFVSRKRKCNNDLGKLFDETQRLETKLRQKESDLAETQAIKNNPDSVGDTPQSSSNCPKVIGSIKGTITKTKKEIDICVSRTEETKRKLAVLDDVLEKIREAYSIIEKYISDYPSRLAASRREAYEEFNEKNSAVSELRVFFETGSVSSQMKEKLKTYSFCVQLLSTLESEYPGREIQMLAVLYGVGCIDIFDDPFKKYLDEHPEELSTFFGNQFGDVDGEINDTPDFTNWLEFIIESTLQNGADIVRVKEFSHFWNSLTSTKSWGYVLELIMQHYRGDCADILAKLILSANGTALKPLLQIANELIDSERIDGVSSLAKSLIENRTEHDNCAEIVTRLIQKVEDTNDRLTRTNERSQYRISKLSSEAYGALSQPIEALELLASNLDSSSGKISVDIVATQLKKNIVSLRNGLEVVGVQTVADVDDWRLKRVIPFDPVNHSISIPTPPQSVYLRSLGFSYKNIEGETKLHPAKVGRIQDLNTAAVCHIENTPQVKKQRPSSGKGKINSRGGNKGGEKV